MSDKTQDDTKYFSDVEKIIKEGINIGADAIELEYCDEGLEVIYIIKDSGFGSVIKGHKKINGIINQIARKSKVSRIRRGKMTIEINNRKHRVVVEEYENFVQSAFRLILREYNK